MHAGILGTGLIGGSIGLGLVEQGWQVSGWDPDTTVLEAAIGRGAIGNGAESETALLDGQPDLVVIAAPPLPTIDLVSRIEYDGLVIDTAGVKGSVIEASRLARLVGTHPMAGREVSGPAAASAGLFRGAAWVIVTDGAEADDVETVAALVTSLGARPVPMTAAAHDRAVAAISHLPQLLAASLVQSVAGSEEALGLAAGSFRDLTRVAASDPALWIEVLAANHEEVHEAIATFRERLDVIERALQESDDPRLRKELATAREVRRAMTARAVVVRVALEDRPGQLALVGRALEESGVDVRDIQLRHAPYGGGGVLTLTVLPGGAEPLRAALSAEGLLLAD